jgi:hypothetical protein
MSPESALSNRDVVPPGRFGPGGSDSRRSHPVASDGRSRLLLRRIGPGDATPSRSAGGVRHARVLVGLRWWWFPT